MIDNDLRTITIPEGVKHLGVENDDEVLGLRFRMPKEYDGIDLSSFDIRVKYVNADGDGDVDTIQNKIVTADNIEFTWLVSKFAVASKGEVEFNVCLRKLSGSNVDKEFNTTPAKLPVLRGLMVEEQMKQKYPDIIEEWHQEILGQFSGQVDTTLKRAGLAADAAVTGKKISELSDTLNSKASKTELVTQRERINRIITSQDRVADMAELYDIRVGVDGLLYPNAGEAVREQLRYRYPYHGALPNNTDLNSINYNGFWFIQGSGTYENLPESNRGGLFMVYYNDIYRWYQVYYSAANGKAYWRNYNAKWNPWVRLLNNTDLASIDALSEYSIEKVNDETVDIYRPGENGFIQYRFGRHVDTSINLDTWRLQYIYMCDKNKSILHTVSSIGFDVEGVVLLSGEGDHIGGCHGDEQYTGYFLFVDGKQYTFDNITNMSCRDIRIIVNSNLTHANTKDVCMTRNKQIIFDKNGVSIRCCWIPIEELNITSIRACMLSINKECFTHYYDSNVYLTPVEVSESTESSIVSTDTDIVDMHYIGGITAHHWFNCRGGDEANYGTIVQDYGTRVKSYFNCYDNTVVKSGDKLFAENNFDISY